MSMDEGDRKTEGVLTIEDTSVLSPGVMLPNNMLHVVQTPTDYCLVIHGDDSKPILTITYDGTITYKDRVIEADEDLRRACQFMVETFRRSYE